MDVGGEERPSCFGSGRAHRGAGGRHGAHDDRDDLPQPQRARTRGQFTVPAAAGQQVVGFALDVDGRMREAVPVAKERGRQVFEAIEREGVDPGLLEQTQGEFFRLRVYPFPASGTRRVRVELVEPLRQVEGGSAVTLPLAFAAGLKQLEVRMRGPQPPRVEGGVSIAEADAGGRRPLPGDVQRPVQPRARDQPRLPDQHGACGAGAVARRGSLLRGRSAGRRAVPASRSARARRSGVGQFHVWRRPRARP